MNNLLIKQKLPFVGSYRNLVGLLILQNCIPYFSRVIYREDMLNYVKKRESLFLLYSWVYIKFLHSQPEYLSIRVRIKCKSNPFALKTFFEMLCKSLLKRILDVIQFLFEWKSFRIILVVVWTLLNTFFTNQDEQVEPIWSFSQFRSFSLGLTSNKAIQIVNKVLKYSKHFTILVWISCKMIKKPIRASNENLKVLTATSVMKLNWNTKVYIERKLQDSQTQIFRTLHVYEQTKRW